MTIATKAGRAGQSARNGRLLSLPAVIVLLIGSAGPLLIVVYYSVMTKGEQFRVQPPFTFEAWFRVVFARDIFDGTVSFADAELLNLWRSVKLSFLTAVITFALGLPGAAPGNPADHSAGDYRRQHSGVCARAGGLVTPRVLGENKNMMICMCGCRRAGRHG